MNRVALKDFEQVAAEYGLTHEQADEVLDVVYRYLHEPQSQGLDGLGNQLKRQMTKSGIDRSDDQWESLALGAASVLGADGNAGRRAR
jgi:hypothetical protein